MAQINSSLYHLSVEINHFFFLSCFIYSCITFNNFGFKKFFHIKIFLQTHAFRAASCKKSIRKNNSIRKNKSTRKHILDLKMCFLVDLFFLIELFFLIDFYMKRPLILEKFDFSLFAEVPEKVSVKDKLSR